MGANTVGAAGVPLPAPQALYPVSVGNIPGVTGTNRIALPPGGDFIIPAGTWLINPGTYSQVQVLDPVSQQWGPISPGAGSTEVTVNSDGVNYRLANPLGFAVAAVVTSGGTGYTSAPTVAASAGGSVWQAVVGGGISAIVANTAGSGLGYSVPPIISIAAPPTPGLQATAVAAISGGSISAITIVDAGAGYTSLPAVVAIPQASDVNFNPPTGVGTTATTNASLTAVTSFATQVTGVLLVNEGNNPLTVAPALTFTGGGGAGAAATVVMALTVASYSLTSGGSGYVAPAEIKTTGGSLFTTTSGTSQIAQRSAGNGIFVPRQAEIAAAISGTAIVGVASTQGSGVIDGGIFQTPPLAYAAGAGAGSSAVVVLNMGSVSDTAFITPL